VLGLEPRFRVRVSDSHLCATPGHTETFNKVVGSSNNNDNVVYMLSVINLI